MNKHELGRKSTPLHTEHIKSNEALYNYRNDTWGMNCTYSISILYSLPTRISKISKQTIVLRVDDGFPSLYCLVLTYIIKLLPTQ